MTTLYDQIQSEISRLFSGQGASDFRYRSGVFALSDSSILPSSGFIQIDPVINNQPVLMSGDWKFHLSVDSQDIGRAFEIVADTLIETGTAVTAKAIKPSLISTFMDPDNIQAGKTITLYAHNGYTPDRYSELIRRLEESFREQGIRPGPTTNADRIVPGSHYASYRTDTGPDGQYIASDKLEHLPREQRHNPYARPDPYQNLDLSDIRIRAPMPAVAAPLADSAPTWSNHRILAEGPWMRATVETGEQVLRIPLAAPERGFTVGAQQLEELRAILEQSGINSVVHESSTLGPTLRIYSDDFSRLENLRHQIISFSDQSIRNAGFFSVDTTNGSFAMYADISSMTPGEVRNLQLSLEARGISAIERTSSLNGGTQVLSVQGESMGRLIEITSEIPRPAAPTISNHLASTADSAANAAQDLAPRSLLTSLAGAGGSVLKVLGPVGIVLVGVEAVGLSGAAHAATQNGHISSEALYAYEGIMAAHVAQATLDPTLFGGEIVVQRLYDEWASYYDVPPELISSLRPSSITDLFASNSTHSLEQIEFDTVTALIENLNEDQLLRAPPEIQALNEYLQNVNSIQSRFNALQASLIGNGHDSEFLMSYMQAETQLAQYEQAYESYFFDLMEDESLWAEIKSQLVTLVNEEWDPDAPESTPDHANPMQDQVAQHDPVGALLVSGP